MQEYQPKQSRRGWIKNIAIIFLSVMLVLTFFSNTFMNMSLPEVAAVYVTSGTITNQIPVTGTVEPNESYKVTADGSYTLRAVKVRVGDTVEEGQELATYETEVSEELTEKLDAAQDTLKEKQKAYDKAVKDADKNGNYASDYRSLDRLEEKMNEAWDKYNDYIALYSLETGDASIKIIELEKQKADADKNVEAFKKQMTDYTDIYSRIKELETERQTAQAAYDQARIIVDTGPNNMLYKTCGGCSENGTCVCEISATGDSSCHCQGCASGNGGSCNCRVADHIITQSEYDNNEMALRTNADRLEQIVTELNVCYKQVNDLNLLYTANATQDEILEMLESTQTTLGDYIKYYTEAQSRYDAAEAAEDAYEDAKFALQDKVASDSETSQSEVQDAKDALDEAQADYDEIKAEVDAKGGSSTVTSPVSGVIINIVKQAGEKVSGGEDLFQIELTGKGYLLSTKMTTDQARQIRVGDKAEVQNNWWGNIDVTVAAIKNDPDNPGRGNIVEFIVTGDVSANQSLSLTVGSRSANYEILVPNSALREDSNGKYILIVESKSNPLGNRYFAKRVDVTVLASDSKYSALSGELFGSEFVITTATSPIQTGMQVRMAE